MDTRIITTFENSARLHFPIFLRKTRSDGVKLILVIKPALEAQLQYYLLICSYVPLALMWPVAECKTGLTMYNCESIKQTYLHKNIL